MKEVFFMWKDTRMIVLTAMSAAIYAAVLIPFKPIPIIPGFTEIRPANALPIVCSLLFGPAGAWGAAFGNLIGDFFGTLGPGSIFGFIGNFFYGLLPYKIWSLISKKEPLIRGVKGWSLYLSIAFLASAICGVIIGWGVHLLGLVPFTALGNIITLNNFIVSIVLGPILLFILYPRAKKWGLLYHEILEPLPRRRFGGLGHGLLWLGAIAGLLLGNLISAGIYRTAFFGMGFGQEVGGTLVMGVGLLPVIILIFIASLLV